MADHKKMRKEAEDAFRAKIRKQYPELTLYQLMQFETAAFRAAQKLVWTRLKKRTQQTGCN